jgi:hypothetical protein
LDATGRFAISYQPPADPTAVLYLVAEGQRAGGQRSIALAAVLDPARILPDVVVNERTTVATAYAMAQFTNGRRVGGKAPGLQNAAGTAQNLADVATGGIGSVLGSHPNGALTSTLPTFNSLANMLAACVQDAANCEALFAAARPPRGAAPDDTLEAMVNIAHNPWLRVPELFAVSQLQAQYEPALAAGEAPDAWTLAIRYHGDGPLGQEIDGPGNLAFDANGNAWVTSSRSTRSRKSAAATR